MSMTDPVADLLTRIRNACKARHKSVDIPASKLKREIARVLAEERFIDNFAQYEDGKQGQLRLYLRYGSNELSIIRGLRRLSKPGLRRYAAKGELPRVRARGKSELRRAACWVTPRPGDGTESAAESRPPFGTASWAITRRRKVPEGKGETVR